VANLTKVEIYAGRDSFTFEAFNITLNVRAGTDPNNPGALLYTNTFPHTDLPVVSIFDPPSVGITKTMDVNSTTGFIVEVVPDEQADGGGYTATCNLYSGDTAEGDTVTGWKDPAGYGTWASHADCPLAKFTVDSVVKETNPGWSSHGQNIMMTSDSPSVNLNSTRYAVAWQPPATKYFAAVHSGGSAPGIRLYSYTSTITELKYLSNTVIDPAFVAQQVKIDSTGRYLYVLGSMATSPKERRVYRMSRALEIDTSWGTNGYAVWNNDSTATFSRFAIDPSGNIFCVGNDTTGTTASAMAYFNSSGVLQWEGLLYISTGDQTETLGLDAAFASDGSPLAASDATHCVCRMNASDGSLIDTYAVSGYYTAELKILASGGKLYINDYYSGAGTTLTRFGEGSYDTYDYSDSTKDFLPISDFFVHSENGYLFLGNTQSGGGAADKIHSVEKNDGTTVKASYQFSASVNPYACCELTSGDVIYTTAAVSSADGGPYGIWVFDKDLGYKTGIASASGSVPSVASFASLPPRQIYYIANYTYSKLYTVSDDGVTLTLEDLEQDIPRCDGNFVWDDDGSLWCGGWNFGPRLYKLDVNDLSILKDVGPTGQSNNGCMTKRYGYAGGNIYFGTQNNSNNVNWHKYDISEDTWTAYTAYSTNHYCAGVATDPSGLYVYVYIIFHSSVLTPRIARWNVAQNEFDLYFHTAKQSGYTSSNIGLAFMPDGSLSVYETLGTTSGSLSNYDVSTGTPTLNYSPVTVNIGAALGHGHWKGDLMFLAGQGVKEVETFNYKTGVSTGNSYTTVP
jgi:hypothetical protein